MTKRNIHPEWSDHKWTVLTTGVKAPQDELMMHLRPRSEVAEAACDHTQIEALLARPTSSKATT